MRRIALHTLGCKLNYAETASIGRRFAGEGYEVVGLDEPADVVLINTCSVTEQADRECRQIVRRALRHSPNALVAVTGCYAQLRPAEIAAIEGVDLVLGTKEKFDLPQYLRDTRKRSRAEVVVSCIDELRDTGVASSAGFEDRTRAFLKVQDGCDYGCSYCTIPLARGSSRSVPAERVVEEARSAVARGYREIVLTGVNVGDYSDSGAANLLALLRLLTGIDGLERIRIGSIEPNLLTDELLGWWVDQPKLCRHWHVPLQSGSDPVLRMMRRRYLTPVYRDRIERIRASVPDAGIGADVIVGFPGETNDLFEESYRFLLDLSVTYLHVFSYSARPDTPAASFEEQVSPALKAERSKRLRALSLRKRRQYHERLVGRTADVLFEEARGTGEVTGLTSEYVRINATSPQSLTNVIRNVRITEAGPEACRGIIL